MSINIAFMLKPIEARRKRTFGDVAAPHPSLKAISTDPPPANSLTMHSRLVAKTQKTQKISKKTKFSLKPSVEKMGPYLGTS